MPVIRGHKFTATGQGDINLNISEIIDKIEVFKSSYPRIVKDIRAWLKRERSSLMGDRSKDPGRKKGYRHTLRKKRLRRRKGYWAPGVVGQFKGYVSKDTDLNKIKMEAGIFVSTSRLKRGLLKIHHGGSIRSSRPMIIPIYKNLAALGYHGPFFSGGASKGLKNKAFKTFLDKGLLKIINKNGKMYAFHKDSYNKRTRRYKRSGLLFIGLKQITIPKTLKGNYDLIARFNKRRMSVMNRGRAALLRSIKKQLKRRRR